MQGLSARDRDMDTENDPLETMLAAWFRAGRFLRFSHFGYRYVTVSDKGLRLSWFGSGFAVSSG